jgi:hypothetical protein
MSAINRIAGAMLVGVLVGTPGIVMAQGARNGHAGANAPATAVQQRDRTREHARTGAQAREQQKLQKRLRVRTEEQVQDPAATGTRGRDRKGN